MNSKRGQFFILATLIIATLVVSLTLGANKVNSRGEQKDFSSFADEFDYELSRVIDYNASNGENKISDFINVSVDYLNFVYPETGLVVYYISSDKLFMENYLISGISCMNFSGSSSCKSPGEKSSLDLNSERSVNLSADGIDFSYNFSKGSKSYIVFIREINGERYVNVKE